MCEILSCFNVIGELNTNERMLDLEQSRVRLRLSTDTLDDLALPAGFTLELWVNFPLDGTPDGDGTVEMIPIAAKTLANNQWQYPFATFGLAWSTGNSVSAFFTDDALDEVFHVGNQTVTAGEWHHLAMTFNPSAPEGNTEVCLIVDGDESCEDYVGVITLDWDNGDRLYLAAGEDPGEHVDLALDELRLWAQVDNATVIRERSFVVLTEYGTEHDGLRAYWNFEAGDLTDAKDPTETHNIDNNGAAEFLVSTNPLTLETECSGSGYCNSEGECTCTRGATGDDCSNPAPEEGESIGWFEEWIGTLLPEWVSELPPFVWAILGATACIGIISLYAMYSLRQNLKQMRKVNEKKALDEAKLAAMVAQAGMGGGQPIATAQMRRPSNSSKHSHHSGGRGRSGSGHSNNKGRSGSGRSGSGSGRRKNSSSSKTPKRKYSNGSRGRSGSKSKDKKKDKKKDAADEAWTPTVVDFPSREPSPEKTRPVEQPAKKSGSGSGRGRSRSGSKDRRKSSLAGREKAEGRRPSASSKKGGRDRSKSKEKLMKKKKEDAVVIPDLMNGDDGLVAAYASFENYETALDGPVYTADLVNDLYRALNENGKENAIALLRSASNYDADEVAVSLVHLFQEKGSLVALVRAAVREEVKESDTPKEVFQGSKATTKLVSAALSLTGTSYLESVLPGPVSSVYEHCTSEDTEIDPKFAKTKAGISRAAVTLRQVISRFSTALTNSARVPLPVRAILHELKTALVSKWSSEPWEPVVASVVYLRYLSPAIVSPAKRWKQNVSEAAMLARVQRTLVLVSKVMQAAANDATLGAKEQWMEVMNDTVKKVGDQIRTWIFELADAGISDESLKDLDIPHFERDVEFSIKHLHAYIAGPALDEARAADAGLDVSRMKKAVAAMGHPPQVRDQRVGWKTSMRLLM